MIPCNSLLCMVSKKKSLEEECKEQRVGWREKKVLGEEKRARRVELEKKALGEEREGEDGRVMERHC